MVGRGTYDRSSATPIDSLMTIIVVTWGTPKTTERLVRYLLRTWPTIRILVVNCGGAHLPLADERLSQLVAANLGYAGGNNLGFEEAFRAGAEYLLVLNSDAFPLVGSLEALRETLESNPNV